MGFGLLWTAAATLICIFDPDDYFARLFPIWGVLMLGGFFYGTKPRTEVITLDRGGLTTSGAFQRLSRRHVQIPDIGGFVLRSPGLRDIIQGPQPARGISPDQVSLFATTEPVPGGLATRTKPWHMFIAFEHMADFLGGLAATNQHREVALAVQARDEDLAKIAEVLAQHLMSLKTQGSAALPQVCPDGET